MALTLVRVYAAAAAAAAGGGASAGVQFADQSGHSDSEGNTSGEAGLRQGGPAAASVEASPAGERQVTRSQTQLQRSAGLQVSPARPTDYCPPRGMMRCHVEYIVAPALPACGASGARAALCRRAA